MENDEKKSELNESQALYVEHDQNKKIWGVCE